MPEKRGQLNITGPLALFALVRHAADRTGQSTSEWVCSAMRDEIKRQLREPSLDELAESIKPAPAPGRGR